MAFREKRQFGGGRCNEVTIRPFKVMSYLRGFGGDLLKVIAVMSYLISYDFRTNILSTKYIVL